MASPKQCLGLRRWGDKLPTMAVLIVQQGASSWRCYPCSLTISLEAVTPRRVPETGPGSPHLKLILARVLLRVTSHAFRVGSILSALGAVKQPLTSNAVV